MRTAVSERIPVVTTKCSARHAFGLRRPSGGPTNPVASASSPSTSALWGECRQPSALTAGRPGDAQSIQVRRVSSSLLVVLDALRNVALRHEAWGGALLRVA